MAIESISGNSIQPPLSNKANAKETSQVQPKASGVSAGNTIDFSSTTHTFKAALAASSSPVVNEDRVAAIKAAVQSGSYHIDSAKVAQKILQFEQNLPNST
jgi:negative regulator of flagellin synthesis FlgM